MLLAEDMNGKKVEPFQGGKAYCPGCKTEVFAKCGSINIAHWAHESLEDCDGWNYEPKTHWHLHWQNLFHKDDTEVIIKKDGKFHIADIVGLNDWVIEIQNSPISTEQILAREHFYEKMIWIVNARFFVANLTILGFDPDIDEGVLKTLIEYERDSRGLTTRIVLTVPEDDDLIIENCLRSDPWLYRQDEEIENTWYVDRPALLSNQELPLDLRSSFIAYGLKYKFLERIEDDSISTSIHFDWRFMRKTWLFAKQPIFLDICSSHLLWITNRDYHNHFSGKIISKKRFLHKYRKRLPGL
jgi:competence protein CoiA